LTKAGGTHRIFVALSAPRGRIATMAERTKWAGCGLHGVACPTGRTSFGDLIVLEPVRLGRAAAQSGESCERDLERAAEHRYCHRSPSA
jgi:hypothetical protein